MAMWRAVGALVIVLSLAGGLRAQTYTLAETPRADECFRMHLDLTLSGELKVSQNGMIIPLPLKSSATIDFPERILAVDAQGIPAKTARAYETAQTTITVGTDSSTRLLRENRRLLVAQRGKEQVTVYSPVGPLRREELELTSQHLDTLTLTGLLPGKEVKINDTWKIANPIAQTLCAFEGLSSNELTGKLVAVENNIAVFSITGTTGGIDLGANVKLTLEATGRFDLTQRRLVALTWKEKDERDQGPVSPAAVFESTTQLTRVVIEQPQSLSEVALVQVPQGDPAPFLMQMYYMDPQARFDVAYPREWQIVGQTNDHLILRLMERGDLVAQATISPWTRGKPGEHLSADEFRQAMAQSPGWTPEMEIQADEVKLDGGVWCYRISAIGKLDEMKVSQNFYIVAAPSGEQVVLTFTMDPKQVEKLGTRDLSLAASLDFPLARKNQAKPK